MKCGARIALGVGVGYLLGRQHKMRLAMMLAAAGATGKLGGGSRELLTQGMQRLSSSPELSKLTESVRGELVDTVKSAALHAATSRVESLNQRLQRPSAPSAPSGKKGAAEGESQDQAQDQEEVEEEPQDEAEEQGPDQAADEAEDREEPEDEAEDREEPEDETDEKAGDEEPEPEDEDLKEEPERPAANRRRPAARSGGSAGRAPVRRTRR
jgi:hypothetical protein